MKLGGCTRLLLALAVVVAGFGGSATAQAAPRELPSAGFGSKTDPMTSDHGAGGMPTPLFRFFNPCDHFGATASHHETFPIWANLGYGYDRRYGLEASGKGWVSRATLVCAKESIPAFVGRTTALSCSKGRLVTNSVGYSHGVGPIVIPAWTANDPSRWWAEGSVLMSNLGWVPAQLTIWWLCA